ncbi:TetR/AcrR family transcriptional regulator [Hamadaea tsunoensis]|uniref:TetR/AcrR family transcriptional regulator n=1 Tax=Hamadaea tsunoensis TaxID=53368 RepID=UPI000429B9A5|nr:TetR/AcrR family transcriptional regulator [Hamadaea tsunoensis]
MTSTAQASTEPQRDRERTRAEILDVATAEFAAAGYAGARVDEIAAATRTTKRMIYYYFENKKQLYMAVLQRAYMRIRDAEQDVDVAHLDPVTAVRRIAETTFDHHEAHPDFIRLVCVENIHRAEHLAELVQTVDLRTPVVHQLDVLLRRGREQGVFRPGCDAIDLHMMISSYCFFRVANRHTFGAIFDRDLVDPAERGHYRTMLGDMVVRFLAA